MIIRIFSINKFKFKTQYKFMFFKNLYMNYLKKKRYYSKQYKYS